MTILTILNIKTIIIQDFLQQIKPFKFIFILVVSIIFTIIITNVQTRDYKEHFYNYENELKREKEYQHQIRVFSEYRVTMIKSPNPFQLFKKGLINSSELWQKYQFLIIQN